MKNKKLQGASGRVVKAYGNLLKVSFEGNICQGEVAFVITGGVGLKAETIEICGSEAKLQVFEETHGVKMDDEVQFSGHRLEAELGPGLLKNVVDGLQNRLEVLAPQTGAFLKRGVYVTALDHQVLWDYTPVAKVGDALIRGDVLGTVPESHFCHKVMLPFSCFHKVNITWVISPGKYTVNTVVAKGKGPDGIDQEFTMLQKWPIKEPLIEGQKVSPTEPLSVGLRILDTQVPVLKGGTFCTPGPFGAGKTVLQHHLSRYAKTDVVILCACGERAGEVVEVLQEFPFLNDPYTKEPLINRTAIICNTSSMPVAAREASIYMGITIAEYYRQMGLDVLLLADSTSRWAQALREMSGRLEEIPGEEAFPAYLSSRISAFYERAGVLALQEGIHGSLTICGSVSPAGGNFEEPVTRATLSIVGAFCGLSKARADSRRYPAIDPLISWSKYLDQVGIVMEKHSLGWLDTVLQAQKLLEERNEIEQRMEVVGSDGISISDMEIFLKGELYDFCYLQQNAFDPVDNYCSSERQLELLKLMQKIFNTSFAYSDGDSIREYFLILQSKIKNLNALVFKSVEYQENNQAIEQFVEQHIREVS
ncbi:V-type ATP synthase alpha chain [Candidatus Clavichlamydia salmonicola]|uniref:V-type ATP synthase subunit A n=1 Tax=Candidatus Clavichlamydia salmonicola TaxID=469812 RepID=UPI001891A1B8|nr:V-type ATP synthase subunit A [Candidatus Clavichlamydia salmonicola]MBF5051111.1 V-type ATP synthase alpha chain [Candidatus Clavichlamydia salmonicola]